MLFLSNDFSQNHFLKNSFMKYYQCQTVSIQIRPNILHFVGPGLGPKCLQDYQQMTLVGKELKDSFKNIISHKKHFWYSLEKRFINKLPMKMWANS